ncbi:HAAS signaling domain-containing protein [Phytohabitans kaempferiae]|uniref:Uncharacterized protein n=1 Tax=Phytohabitans kaempferiae TaxID=1620943 RepID=A0ABV6LV50_9ACTN
MNEVADYVAQVRAALSGLPPRVRDELLEDLPEHLAEVAAEGEGSLVERLGPPVAYAAELRAAIGGTDRSTVDTRLRDAVVRARARLRAVDDRTGPIIGYEKASDFLRLMLPAWWVARGYLVAMAIAHLIREREIGLLPRVDFGNRTVAGVLVLVLFVVGSVWIGRRSSRLPRLTRVGLGVGSALLILPALAGLSEADGDSRRPPYLQITEYRDVESVYVFDEQGRAITTARVFDENGEQVQPGHWWCGGDRTIIVAQLDPRCASPEPLEWSPERVGPIEHGRPEPAVTPPPTLPPAGTPTPAPSATG